MPSFGDSIFLFVLALLLFGPKKLPVLARELGKWIGEFRRASNEFKMQMEEELRQVEQADREKRISAIEAAAPIAPALEASTDSAAEVPESSSTEAEEYPYTGDAENEYLSTDVSETPVDAPSSEPGAQPAPEPLPIASSGTLSIMPPATGLPTPHATPQAKSDPFGGGLLDAIPEAVIPKTAIPQPTVPEAAETSRSTPSTSAVAVVTEREANVS